ncbi:hypothetical protein HU200_035552 [Digitaria exilis]|uniref:SAM domain-containing protein n=1 Tax=Digitaria exilis TaxID=1010633 RepID=A0A835ELR6_9POAL|nr:hypothetical protein HU200_035552 [Digitaria exilis]CAB3467235.1 unnamed protein product [Digitaria exilis]
MDWYAWLCRAGLHPDVALEYALLFARNELGAADVRHLDHDFLSSMGVSVAKHRLEILKLARKDSSVASALTSLPSRATSLLASAARSALSPLLRRRASSSSSSSSRGGGGRDKVRALAAPRLPPMMMRVMRHRGGGRVAHSWGKTMLVAASPSAGKKKASPLALPMTPTHVSNPVVLTSSCAATAKALPAPPPVVVAGGGCLATITETCGCDDDEDDAGEEEMRWESMFQDLKPN